MGLLGSAGSKAYGFLLKSGPGIPSIGVFFGGTNPGGGATARNVVTRINACGALVGVETSVGTVRYDHASANNGTNVIYYAGNSAINTGTQTADRINKCGALVGTTTPTAYSSFGNQVKGNAGSKLGVNTLFHASFSGPLYTRLNRCGALVSSTTGTQIAPYPAVTGICACNGIAGSGDQIGNFAQFFGGNYLCGCGACATTNLLIRVNQCVTAVTTHTPASCRYSNMAGAKVGNNALYHGGGNASIGGTGTNRVIRINSCGAVVGSIGSAGTVNRVKHGGAGVNNTIGIFFGGTASSGSTNRIRINACGTMIGTEAAIGTARCLVEGGGA